MKSLEGENELESLDWVMALIKYKLQISSSKDKFSSISDLGFSCLENKIEETNSKSIFRLLICYDYLLVQKPGRSDSILM